MSIVIPQIWRVRTHRATAVAEGAVSGKLDPCKPLDCAGSARTEVSAAAMAEPVGGFLGADWIPGRDYLSAVDISSTTMMVVRPCPFWKRTLDVVGTLAGLVILAPVLILVAFFIKCASRGPIFFQQRRYGLAGQPFKVWKFRTIKSEEAPEQHQSYVIDLMASGRPIEKRDKELALIPGGRILRKLGIDELPQLVNVLKGEMSLVGPRPDVVPFEHYQPWQQARFSVQPGITGLWQVSGKNQTTFTQMIQLDVAYIRQRSLWLDLRIIVLTIPAILWD